jgi:glutaredoxin
MMTRWLMCSWLCLAWLAFGCADRSPAPEHFADDDREEKDTSARREVSFRPAPSEDASPSDDRPAPARPPSDGAHPKVKAAAALAAEGKLEELVGAVEPKEAMALSEADRSTLADIYHRAADHMLNRNRDVSFASLFCERGLLVQPEHQGLLRLQIEIYMHPDMNLIDGAEELAVRLVRVDPEHQRNQLLRGKVAFEQGQYDQAVTWLTRAARSGRTQQSKEIEEAWKLLEMAKVKAEEMKAALSMTRELEVRLQRAKTIAQSHAAASPRQSEPPIGESLRPGGDEAAGPITLYMTKWCKFCRQTADLLKGLNVKFEQKDIERDQAALVDLMELAQAQGVEVTGVPVLRMGNKLVVGFNPELIERMVKK